MPHTKTDHALIIIKAGLNAVPIIGGSLASLIADYVPLSTQRSIEKATLHLGEQLERLQDRVDTETVNRDEFADLFKSAYLVIVRTTNETKLRAAAAILTNILLKNGDQEKLSFTELDHFVRSLDQLSTGALSVLALVYRLGIASAPPIYDKGDIRESLAALGSEQGIRLTFGEIHAEAGNIDTSLLMGLVSELNAGNLVHIAQAPAVRSPNFGNYPVELTTLGIRFVERILGAN